MISRRQKRLYEILELSGHDRAGRWVNTFLITLIVLNVTAVSLSTVSALSATYAGFFHVFEEISVFIFTVEYLLRAWICVVNEHYRHPVAGRIKHVFTPFAIIDLLAIAPFYLPMIIPFHLVFIRVLRLLRLFRLLKLGRYSESIRTFGAIFKAKREEMAVAMTMAAMLLVFAAGLMYFIESGAQPEAFSSIPATMWWAVETMTTVGYGDVYPVTPAGKVLAAVIAILGIAIFLLPAGIMAAGYAEHMQHRHNGRVACPKCGHEMDV
jgi:voltage-gated potassium channel